MRRNGHPDCDTIELDNDRILHQIVSSKAASIERYRDLDRKAFCLVGGKSNIPLVPLQGDHIFSRSRHGTADIINA